VLQAESRLAQAENTLVQANNTVDTQIARLNTLLNIPLSANVEYVGKLEYAPFSLSFEDCLDRAYEQRPDLEIAKKSVMIAAKDKKINDSEFWPQVAANFDWTTTGDDPTVSGYSSGSTGFSQWSVGVGATWKFFESGKVYYASRQAQERVNQLVAEADNTRQEASFEVKSNHLDIDDAAERIIVARKALVASRESYRMALARYQAQVGTNIDVLDAQAQLTQSEADLTQALSDYQIALARIFVSMGEKNPGLETY
jgi:outer membrane protein